MSKKSVFMLKQIIELLLAIIAILIILYAGIVLFRTYFGRQAEMQAKGTLEQLVITLNKANETGQTESYILLNPAGWYIVAFNASRNENEGFVKPTAFFGKNALCICKKRCTSEICRQIKMPLMQAERQALIAIEIKDLYFTNMKDYWNVSDKRVEIRKLTEDEKTRYGITKVEIEQQHSAALTAAAENHYPEVKSYFKSAYDFRAFIMAIVYIESGGKADVLGVCGEVGLMQLMPQTARELGLKVPQYKKICEGNCRELSYDCSVAFECNKKSPEQCNKGEDERFDAAKSIEAGTKYIVELIKQFNDLSLALAAYNAGMERVQEACKPLRDIEDCPSGFAGRQYASSVMSHYRA